MRFKLTILLVILNVALLSYIFYFKKIQSTRSLFDESNRFILNPSFVQEIDRIEFTSTHLDEPWILAKADDQWLVDSPIQWKANPFAIEQLLFQLRRLSWESRFSVEDVKNSGRSLQAYGLENPPLHLDLHNKDLTLTLALGAPTEIGNRLYLMSPDGVFVYVVNRSLLDILQRDLDAFLDRRVFGMAARSIRGVQIQDRMRSNVRVRLERQDQDWEFVSPIATPADTEQVEGFIQEWQSLEIDSFLKKEVDPGRLGGDSMRLTLEGMGRRETLYLEPPAESDPGDSYLARHEDYPAVFTISSQIVAELRTAQEDLRERRILRDFSQDWTSMEIQFGASNVTIQQLESGDWQVLHKDSEGQLRSAAAAPEAILALEELLDTVEAESFVSDAPSETDLERFGFGEPQRRVILRIPEARDVEFIIGGIADNGKTLFYGRTNQSNSVFLVRPHILSALSLVPLDYRDRTVRELPDTVQLDGVDLIERDSGQSLLANHLEMNAQSTVPDFLEQYLRVTHVDRYVNKKFTDPLALDSRDVLEWPYILEAKMTYPNNPSGTTDLIQLYISRRLGGITQYMGDPVSGLVGTLPMAMIEALDPLLTKNPEDPEAPDEPVPETESSLIP